MECNFRVGQKVVCVDAGGIEYPDAKLEEGGVYTIRTIGPIPEWQKKYYVTRRQSTVGVRLREVVRGEPIAKGYEEPTYCALRFRPLVTTDISVFQEMLINPHVPIKEDA